MPRREAVLERLGAFGPPEPYRIKMVEPVHRSTRAEREAQLAQAGYNLFRIPAEQVWIDLLTDSGTGAMSSGQWAALMQGDESYAGARSFYRFEATVREVFGLPHVIPTHQGRAAEHLLFGELVRPGQKALANTFFDTTRANAEQAGAQAIDLPSPMASEQVAPFKGDVDLDRVAAVLRSSPGEVAAVVLTVTNNAAGGQPVSLANIRETRDLCQQHGVPLVVDASRIAENAFFIKEREDGWASAPVAAIVGAIGECADVISMSAKKDGLANIGGFLALRDDALAERIRRRMVVTEGFPTYGGLAGRDLEAIAVGLREALDEAYLAHRIGQVRFLAVLLRDLGVPLLEPPGGHGVFVDAGAFLQHIPRERFPGQALAIALYAEAGVRSCEIGSVMFGADSGSRRPELVRLAIPRRVYTEAQLALVARAFASLQEKLASVRGVVIVEQPPVLRHFTARFAPV
ncbi:MAG: tryptophanase [Chloroflexi bacterium]|nr:tryptophanase [Chloroflexota bacterium]